MKRIGFLLLAVVTVAGIVAHMTHASGQSDGDSINQWTLVQTEQSGKMIERSDPDESHALPTF